MLTIGIGDEDLSEVVACHQSDDLFHALSVELVKNVIEQQDGRRLVVGAFKEVKLRQLQ